MPYVYESLIDTDGGYRLHILLGADDADPKLAVVRVECSKAQERVTVELLSVEDYKP
jgi:hypothetical protein